MSRLIHLNGPPGIGKSTLARRYATEHPGVLNCDVDVLRTLIGGWESDFAGAGNLIRPAALAMIKAYLASGHDVVFPQLLTDPVEVELFGACATDLGAEFQERVLMDTPASTVARFHRRGAFETHDPWHDHVRTIVAAAGGDAVLTRSHQALESLLSERPGAVRITSADGAADETYQLFLGSLA